MTIDEYLNRQRIEILQGFELFWTDVRRTTSSKSLLLTRLRRAMLDPAVLETRFNVLPASERHILEFLLHTLQARSSLPEAPGTTLDASAESLRSILHSLATRGFIEFRSESGGHDPSQGALIPDELAHALRQLLQRDFRHPEQILSLQSHIGSPAPAPASPEPAPSPSPPPIDDPDPVPARLARLPTPELREWVEKAMTEHLGILPIDTLRRSRSRMDEKRFQDWQAAMEQARVGTVGTLNLEHLGINLRGEFLVVFLEITEAYLTRSACDPARVPGEVLSSGFSVLLDFFELLKQCQRESLRINQTGTLRKHGADEVSRSLLFAPPLNPDDPAEYLEQLVRRAIDLRLVQCMDDGTLIPASRAIAWSARSVSEQTQDLLLPVLEADMVSRESYHAAQVCRRLGGWVRQLIPGAWYPCEQAASLGVVRYLLDLVRCGLSLEDLAACAVHSHPMSPSSLAEAFLRWLQGQPLRLGIIDMAFAGGRPAFLRSTPVAARLFDFPWPAPEKPYHPLIANPDFEIVLFPGTPPEIHTVLHRMARLEKKDKVFHYRIDEASIGTAAALGLSADEMARVLEENSRGFLPQNITYSIRNWAGRVYNTSIKRCYILELQSPDMLQHVQRLPEIEPLVLRELSPTVLALREPPWDRAAVRALQKLGIYIRRDPGERSP